MPEDKVRQWRDASLPSRIARAELFAGYETGAQRSQRGPRSVAEAAFFTTIKLTGGPWDPMAQTEDALEAMRRLQTAQAAGKVLCVRDVPYVRPGETRHGERQQLDAYLPTGGGDRRGLPLVVHFHGGGWQDGDRDDEMFGAPAVARSHASAGCVCVAPSYRLGSHKTFMVDAQRAVLWAVANAEALGADPRRLYLSGHSAGGNIAALLGIGPWLLPPVLPAEYRVKGVIGISGVYTLRRPLGGPMAGYKNGIFDRYLRKPVFGDDVATLTQFSPSALARLGGGKATPFKPRWSDVLGRLAHDTLSIVAVRPPDAAEHESAKAAGGLAGVRWADEAPPVLLINASWDLGLEDDGRHFAKALKAWTGVKPAHHIIPNTNHATVTWDERSIRLCRDFIAACEGEAAAHEAARGRARPGREDGAIAAAA